MSDIFNANEFSSVSDKTWRNFLLESERPAIDAPKDAGSSASADFAKQLAAAQKVELKSYDTAVSDIIDVNNKKVDAANKADKEAAKAAKELSKAGLPDISEQKPLPGNWYDAQKATNYENMPYEQQSKIYNDWLDQAHVRVVTADVSKAKTARADLEARVPAPVKPKAAWHDTDIIDKISEGASGMAKGAYRTIASYMPDGSIKEELYNRATVSAADEKAARTGLNAETLDAEKAVAFREQALATEYGGKDNIPFVTGLKKGAQDLFQGGFVQGIGNIGKSVPSMLPSVVGNAMTIGGTMMTATGAGALAGVPLALAGRVVSTIGGGAATATDVGGQAWEEAYAYAKSQGLSDAEARVKAEEAARQGGAAGAVIGAAEGLVGSFHGAGAIAKKGIAAAGKRIGIEAVTEGVAEGAGAMSVNKILQDQGDKRSLMRGVGEAVSQGAIGGAGMTLGMQAVTSAIGKEAGPVATELKNTPAAVQASISAASAATNNVAQQAQAVVTQAQAAVQAAQATGDDTQVAAATAALQAATAQVQAVGAEPTATSPMAALQAAAAAQDGLDAAIATGNPVQIEQATQAFNAAVMGVQPTAPQGLPVAEAPAIDPAVAERESLNGVQIRDMLDKVEAIPQLIENNKLGLAGAKQALDAVQPLAGAVGRNVNMASGPQQWVKSIKTGAAPIDAVAADSTVDPAQREAAQAVIQAYKATGTALPAYDKSLPVRGNVAGYIRHEGMSPTDPAYIALNKKLATPATIIHEYLHGLTVRGLEFMNRSRNPEHMDVMEALDAIIEFIRQHPSVTNTRAGTVYAAKNNSELLAEGLSGRVLPLTSNITVQDIINKGGLTNGAIRGLEILTNRQPTPLLALFTKARDYILNAMGLAAAKKGSVSDAILSAADIAMGVQKQQVQRVDEENLLPGYTHLGKNAQGNFATSIDQLIVDATPVQDGIYRTADGTMLDTNDSIAQVASNPAVQSLLKAQGFEGFRTEAGETFALGSVDEEQLPALDKKLVATMAQISYSITDPSTTDNQRLKYVAKFLNGTLEPALMEAVNRTGVGLTARAAIETQAPWAEAVMSGDDTLLQVLATSKSDVGEGVAEQARAVLRMYAESGQDMPRVVKIKGLIPFGKDTALGTYDPPTHMIEISDLADPGEVVHEYLHGVTQLGIDAAKKSREGKALRAVMEYMVTTMRATAVRAGEAKPYGLTNEHELMGDMFKPALLRIAAQTPIGTPQSKQAQAMIAELMGERPGTMIELLDALIRKIVSFLGVKSVPNNMTELLSRVAARATDETRKAVNAGFSSIDMEVLPANTVPLSMATLGKDIHGRIAGADYIASIAAGVNVQPTLTSSRMKALAAGQGDKKLFGVVDRLNDAVHDSQGPAKRWIQSLPISEGARERIINILYLAPGKRDNLLNKAMQENGGDAMVKALAVLARDSKGLTIETVTSWVGHWITANHVAEKNAMLVGRKAKAHAAAVQAALAKPNDFRLKLKEAEALQAYKDQVAAVSSTNLDAGSQTPHIAGVAGGLNNAQAAALMHNVEAKIPVDKLREIAEHVYDLNAFRLMSDIEHGKANIDVVAQFLKLQDTTDLIALQEANKQGAVTDMMRKRVAAQVRSEYVPMTGHPLASIDGAEDGMFGTGAAQPNSQKSFTMEGRTSGIADNGIATTMSSLIKSASFAGFADFTTAVGEAHAILSPEQRDAVGLSRVDSITGVTRSSDNMLIDGRTNNKVGYVVQDRSVLEAIRKANVESHNSFLEKVVRPITKGFSYLVTQANPIFGPTNMINDMIERSLTASTREYHTEQGNKITIGATDVVANGPQALAAAYRLARGKPDYTKPSDVALRDIAQKGGLSLSRDTFVRDSASLAKTIARVGAGGTVVGSMRKAIGQGIESYNNVFDMVSPLAAYMALRQAGVSEIDAAGGSLDLMNFRKGGSHMSLFTSTIAFAQPAVTGGANMLRMLGTKKGKVILATSIIGFAAMQMLAAAGADEDEGGNLLYQLPDYMRNNNINFQAGGYTFSIPVGFGTTRLGNTAARIGIDSVVKNKSALESLNDIIFEGMVPAVSPLEDVKIKDQFKKSMYMITPTVLKPVASVVMNVDSQGGVIDREKWVDQNKYRHLQGSKNIAPEYRELAALTHTMSGGFIDLTPEAMRTFVNGYGVGPFKVAVTELITNPHKESQGKETALPVVGALMSSRVKPINEDAWKGQLHEAQTEMEDMRKEHSKLELDKTSEGRVAMRELMAKPEYKLLGVFDTMDKALRNESAQVTRSLTTKQITAPTAEQRKEAIRDRRTDAEVQFLVKWRKVKGLE